MIEQHTIQKLHITITFILFVFAQTAGAGLKSDFGKVDKAFLQMTVYPEDTAAVAVKIFDYGNVEIVVDRRFEMYFEHHYQIKILKDAGKRYADLVIPYWHEDKITSLQAQTILPNGKKQKVDKKSIFDEETKGNWKVKKVAFPKVSPGAIIEIKYELHSDYITNLEPWVFQSDIPVVESKVFLKMLPGFSYNVKIGNDPFHMVEQSEEQYSSISRGSARITKQFVYSATNLPAVRPEPYMSSLKNYRARVDFLIYGYRDQYTSFQFAKDRQTLVNELLDGNHRHFLKPSGDVKDLVSEVIAVDTGRNQKIESIFNYVRDNFDLETTYDHGAYVKRRQDEVLHDKRATSSERNMLLLSMLRAAGLEAEPVLISTWSNGWIDPGFPFLTQFNRSIVAVKKGSKYQLLDASDRMSTVEQLPDEDLTIRGLMLKKEDASMVPIPNEGIRSRETIESVIDLRADGSLSGTTNLVSIGYAAVDRNYDLENSDTVEKFIREEYGEDIDGFEVQTCDSLLRALPRDTLETEFSFKTGAIAELIDDEIYLQPLLFYAQKENIFKTEKRNFPVEFGYLSKSVELNHINLPPSFEVVELPDPVLVNSEFFTYRYTIVATPGNDRQLTATRYFQLKKDYIRPSDYSRLRQYWARLVDGDQIQLILRKNAN
ncbi:MAG: DUF3857 and transglutaminase domain-containing protein [Deferribacteres bacterium]|nr:DUF3857 and transglutaminase domain-containing protein [Deferribacteres bacterium]